MTFEIEIDGRLRSVSVERTARGRYRVALDGNPATAHLVDAVLVGEYGLSLLIDREPGVSRELQIARGSTRGELLVGFEGRTVAVTVNGRRSRTSGAEAAGHETGEQTIVAPMSGRVVRVLVGPGDEVTERQPLVVVEAMKMENELRSPRAGTIKEVTVSAGMSVDAGRVLVTVA